VSVLKCSAPIVKSALNMGAQMRNRHDRGGNLASAERERRTVSA